MMVRFRSASPRHDPSDTMLTMLASSCPIRERPQHHTGAPNARAGRPSVPLQPAVQFPGYRVHVCNTAPRRLTIEPPLTNWPRRYLVVDLMSGGDLRFHISRKTFTEDTVRFWIAELGCALRYVHAQNIIHRDVKPDNVLLDADGHVHLTDFVSPGRQRTPWIRPILLTYGPECRFRCGPRQGHDE